MHDNPVTSTINGTNQGTFLENLVTRMLLNIQRFLYPGEKLSNTINDFRLELGELSNSASSLLDIDGMTYDKNEVFRVMSNPSGGMMLIARNDTFANV